MPLGKPQVTFTQPEEWKNLDPKHRGPVIEEIKANPYEVTVHPPDCAYPLRYACATKEKVTEVLDKHGRDIDFVELVHKATYKCPEGVLLCGYWDTEPEEDLCAITIEGPDVLEWEDLGTITNV